jgi:uncharacterized protein YlxW (UPF0749 family)
MTPLEHSASVNKIPLLGSVEDEKNYQITKKKYEIRKLKNELLQTVNLLYAQTKRLQDDVENHKKMLTDVRVTLETIKE